MKNKNIQFNLTEPGWGAHPWYLNIDLGEKTVSFSGGVCPPESGFHLSIADARKVAKAILENTEEID